VHTSNRSKTLTASVTAKVTPDEKKRFTALAREAELSPSEWCRRALSQAAGCSSETRLLLSELLALRMIVLRLHLDLIEGIDPTNERLKEILERADAKKNALAEQRIQGLQSHPALSKSVGKKEASS
jgi:hypothetical protein